MYKYKMFGFHISSEIKLNALVVDCENSEIDIFIKIEKQTHDISAPYVGTDKCRFNKTQMYLHADDAGDFWVENGNTIRVFPSLSSSPGIIQLYIMGTCFGALLYQRNIMVMHGSCISCNGEATIITGKSGSGKSTLATYFVKNGWTLMSDDIIPIIVKNQVCYAQSTYPGQKLWNDAITRYDDNNRILSSLYLEAGKEKYELSADTAFSYSLVPIKNIILLSKEGDCFCFSDIKGFAKVDLIMRNLYRGYFAQDTESKKNIFATAILLGNQINAFYAMRSEAEYVEKQIFDCFMNF